MAQDSSNSSDMATKFSTLNVNAMEFVPSFSIQPTAAAFSAETDSSVTGTDNTETIETETSSSPIKSSTTTPTEDKSPTKSENEQLQPITEATPTESLNDKSPENPGVYAMHVNHSNTLYCRLVIKKKKIAILI